MNIQLFRHQVPAVQELVREELRNFGKVVAVYPDLTATIHFDGWRTPFMVYSHELPRMPEVGDRVEIVFTLINEQYLQRKFYYVDPVDHVNWKKEGF